MKKRLLYTNLSISLLTVMAGAAIALALGVISAHFEGRNPLLIQLIVSLPALFIILTNLLFPWLCRLMKTRTLALTGLALYVLSCAFSHNGRCINSPPTIPRFVWFTSTLTCLPRYSHSNLQVA